MLIEPQKSSHKVNYGICTIDRNDSFLELSVAKSHRAQSTKSSWVKPDA